MPGILIEGGRPPVVTPPDPGGGGDGDDSNPERGAQRKTSLIGLAVMMIASVITFAALAFAMIVRHRLSNDWVKMPLPAILWPNTAILLASSVFLDLARRGLRGRHRVLFNWFWCIGTLLGAAFLAGQILAWRQLSQSGVYASGNPSNGFFYILTWTHAAHAIVGLGALLWVAQAALRFQLGAAKRTFVAVSVVFWHFLDVLWLGLMLLLIYRG